MGEPKRIQRRRTRGWKMPPNTVYVGRPTKWGNPFIADRPYETVAAGTSVVADAAHAVRLFRPCAWARVEEIQRELRGKNLACWCAVDERHCHADVLLELANK